MSMEEKKIIELPCMTIRTDLTKKNNTERVHNSLKSSLWKRKHIFDRCV